MASSLTFFIITSRISFHTFIFSRKAPSIYHGLVSAMKIYVFKLKLLDSLTLPTQEMCQAFSHGLVNIRRLKTHRTNHRVDKLRRPALSYITLGHGLSLRFALRFVTFTVGNILCTMMRRVVLFQGKHSLHKKKNFKCSRATKGALVNDLCASYFQSIDSKPH